MITMGRLHHVSIVVNDLEASRHFYADVLGMEQAHRPTNFEFKGQWFRIDGGYEVHTIHRSEAIAGGGDGENTPRPDRDITFARHFCFSVSSVEDMLETLAKHGIPIVEGPRARGDGATQTYIYDPDGHMVELVFEPWDWE